MPEDTHLGAGDPRAAASSLGVFVGAGVLLREQRAPGKTGLTLPAAAGRCCDGENRRVEMKGIF